MKGIKEIRHKDGSTVWRVRFRDGKTNASETFPDLETAIYFRDIVQQAGGTAARRILDSHENTTNTDHLTLNDIHEAFLANTKSYATPGTTDRYRFIAKHYIFPKIPKQTPIRSITRETITSLVAWLRTQPSRYGTPLKHRTIQKPVAYLSTIFNHQIKLGNLEHNPARGIRIPKDAPPRQPVFLTPAQVDTIAKACGYHETFVRFLYATGLRFGEATALTPADIDLEARTVTVSKAWKHAENGRLYLGTPKTSTSLRVVTISQTVADLLEPLLAEGTPYVFHPKTRPDRPLGSSAFRYGGWDTVTENMNPRPRIHDLRHSHVSRLIQAGIPLPVIQKRVGHKDIQTTVNVYGHITPDQARAAGDVFD